MSRLTRRCFVQQSAAAAGGLILGSRAQASSGILGANEVVRIAVAGINGRGKEHIKAFGKLKDVRIAYLIDPDSRLFDSRIKMAEEYNKNTPKAVQDFRRVLEDKDVDAISIATCNHWHAPMTIFACQAGKDVYVEKPCSHNVHEGRIAVETARKYGRIVQHGTQSRSSKEWAAISEIARSGRLGKLLVSHGIASKPRDGIGTKPVSEPPAGLDYDLWLGPAPKRPFHENLVHYNWHWFWEFGNGEIGNQGVHQMDIARWGIPDATLPTRVLSIGGRFAYDDQGETPNTQLTVFEFGETLLVFENCNLTNDKTKRVDNDFHFEAGSIIGGDKFVPKPGGKVEKMPEVKVQRGPGGNIFGNFLAAVRSRKVEDLFADILEAHRSAALCHLANASYRLGEDVAFESKSRPFGKHTAANEAWARLEELLVKHRGLKLADLKYRVGPALQFDPVREQFVGERAEEANRLITREYRQPFAIPEKVV